MNAARDPDPSGLAPQARRHLEAELARLRDRHRELAEALAQRDRVGDRGDSAEEIELGDELVWVDERIGEIMARLAGAEPVRNGGLPDGTEVTLRFSDGTVQTLHVVAISEEIPDGAEDTTLTMHSPLGCALAGHQPGDTITYVTPHGPEQVELIDLRLPE